MKLYLVKYKVRYTTHDGLDNVVSHKVNQMKLVATSTLDAMMRAKPLLEGVGTITNISIEESEDDIMTSTQLLQEIRDIISLAYKGYNVEGQVKIPQQAESYYLLKELRDYLKSSSHVVYYNQYCIPRYVTNTIDKCISLLQDSVSNNYYNEALMKLISLGYKLAKIPMQ